MSKIIVAIRKLTDIEVKEYPDADAFINERGELIIERAEKKVKESGEYPTYSRMGAFKEWVYYEKS